MMAKDKKFGIPCVDSAFDMEQYPTWLIIVMFVLLVLCAVAECLQ